MNELLPADDLLPIEYSTRVNWAEAFARITPADERPATEEPLHSVQGDSPIFASPPTRCASDPVVAAKIGTVPAEKPADEPKPDPREVLDAVKRATIVTLVRLGASRRMAAQQVGCCHRTIARTAARNSDFAAELAQAESRADAKALRLIDRATDQEKYWRAAAWMLERRSPEEYGRRAPHTHTNGQVMKMFTRFLHAVLPKLPAECREPVLEEYENVLADLTENPNAEVNREEFKIEDEAPVPAPPPAPLLEKQCPRDEAAARDWLAGLTFEQIGELKERAKDKPRRPDWDRWRGLVDESWERAYERDWKEYRQERRQRRARREARQQEQLPGNGRCAPVHSNGESILTRTS